MEQTVNTIEVNEANDTIQTIEATPTQAPAPAIQPVPSAMDIMLDIRPECDQPKLTLAVNTYKAFTMLARSEKDCAIDPKEQVRAIMDDQEYDDFNKYLEIAQVLAYYRTTGAIMLDAACHGCDEQLRRDLEVVSVYADLGYAAYAPTSSDSEQLKYAVERLQGIKTYASLVKGNRQASGVSHASAASVSSNPNAPSLLSEAIRVIKAAGPEGLRPAEVIRVLREDPVGQTLSCFQGEGKTPVNSLVSALLREKAKGEASRVHQDAVTRAWIA